MVLKICALFPFLQGNNLHNSGKFHDAAQKYILVRGDLQNVITFLYFHFMTQLMLFTNVHF